MGVLFFSIIFYHQSNLLSVFKRNVLTHKLEFVIVWHSTFVWMMLQHQSFAFFFELLESAHGSTHSVDDCNLIIKSLPGIKALGSELWGCLSWHTAKQHQEEDVS